MAFFHPSPASPDLQFPLYLYPLSIYSIPQGTTSNVPPSSLKENKHRMTSSMALYQASDAKAAKTPVRVRSDGTMATDNAISVAESLANYGPSDLTRTGVFAAFASLAPGVWSRWIRDRDIGGIEDREKLGRDERNTRAE
jgi:hypothetical protein